MFLLAVGSVARHISSSDSVRYFLCVCMLATAALAIQCSHAAAQDSFLNQFRVTGHSGPTARIPGRPEYMQNGFEAEASSLQEDLPGQHAGPQPYGLPPDFPNSTLAERAPTAMTEDSAWAQNRVFTEADCETSVACPEMIRYRKTSYQGSQINLGYLQDDPDAGVAVTTVDFYSTFAIPIEGMENLVSIIPYFRSDLLDSAIALDLPGEVYDTGVKALWKRPVSDNLSSLVIVTPSVRSDFTTGDGAFRLFGMALLTWKTIPDRLSLSGGVVYTGREDFPILPAMGLLWTPTPLWKFDIQFPSPRISYLLARNGADSETWMYLAGVFGGNTWAVTRPSGTTDELTLSDLRLVLGMEYIQPENHGIFGEVGYVFNRSVEYTRLPFEAELDSALMVRGGISF